MIARVAFLAFALVHGCAPEPARPPSVVMIDVDTIAPPRAIDATIHGDTRFVREERWIVEDAATNLRRFTSGRARLLILWDFEPWETEALAEAPRILRTPRYLAPPRCGGQVDRAEIRLVVDNCPELYPCALHELAHYAGLEHAKGAEVMAERNPGWLFNSRDRAECVRVGLCERRGL